MQNYARLPRLLASICVIAPLVDGLQRPDGLTRHLPDYKEFWFTQRLDHFSFRADLKNASGTFQQRYIMYDGYWKEREGPVFFYAGNEGPVETYVTNTGLMWQNAEAFEALVIFAEHRYYGKSEPFGPQSWKVDPSYLTTEQALADYAVMIYNITHKLHATNVPLIAFGGSYGGMLATWLRLKYPHLVTGAIAASAPVASFPGGSPPFKPSAFWEIVTRDATAAGGSAPECADNVRAAFRAVFALGDDEAGRAQLRETFRLCDALNGAADVEALAYWLQGAFDSFAMGNYPYPSSYIAGSDEHPLPAWPMRAACSFMAGDMEGAEKVLSGLASAVSVLYNVTQDQQCYTLEQTGPAAGNSGPWDYQFCTELMGQELPYYPTTGVSDMFWDQGPFNLTVINEHCRTAWGVTPRVHWSVTQYGGSRLAAASNIVFSNGLLDPWSAFGILESLSDSVTAVLIPEGAHHLDLMFSHPDDPESVRAARAEEIEYIRRWIGEWREAQVAQRAAQQSLHAGV